MWGARARVCMCAGNERRTGTKKKKKSFLGISLIMIAIWCFAWRGVAWRGVRGCATFAPRSRSAL